MNMCILDTILAVDVKYSLTIGTCQQRWRSNWIHLDLCLGVEQRTVGCLVATNHIKAAVSVLVSQLITAYVGHIRWHLPVDITCGG